MKTSDCTIIVSSFDGYADMWEPFFALFFRYWPDCPFDIYLITNYKKYPDERVTSVQLGEDNGWSANLIQTLNKIDTDYIIYLQEDYFLNGKVNSADIKRMVEIIVAEKAAYLRLIPNSDSVLYKDYRDVQQLPRKVPYLNSTQAAIWDRGVLLSLLEPTESGWDFEKYGGLERARKLDKAFLCSVKWLIPYLATAIEKGRIIPPAIDLCRKEGIKLKTDKKFEGRLHYMLRKNKVVRNLYRMVKCFFGREVR